MIDHISDTAIWIAGYRALESERKDAAFKDGLAKKLAGTRGLQMVASTPHTKAMAFAMTVRTSAIDRLVAHAISNGVDTVINLGAGLDTRPYRMNLPKHLKWIEVDLPGIINYKVGLLEQDQPVCALQHIASDLSNGQERDRLFNRLAAESNKALIITEGVIAYLNKEQASGLGKSIIAIPSFKYWIMDYKQGKKRRRHVNDLKKFLRKTPLVFNEPDPLNFFCQMGWKVKENIAIMDEAEQINRKLPLIFPWSFLIKLFPHQVKKLANKTYGYVMFEQ